MALSGDHTLGVPHDHVVQFYGRDEELAADTAPYLAEAVERGGVALVVATETHRHAFAALLADEGIDPALADAALPPDGPGIVMLDAAEVRDMLLVDGRLAPHRFDKVIGDLVREAAAGGRPVRVFGEIVALMWADGLVTTALELEALWNRLGDEVDFSLYCSYPLRAVEGEGNVEAYHEICRQHSAVVGTPVVLPRFEAPALEVTATFGWGGRAPAETRRFVTATLAAWGCGDLVDDAAVVATELATNAVLHARTDFTVTIGRRPDGTIQVAVRDASPGPPRARRAGPLDGSGRGLGLVEAIAASWGADMEVGGKVVWARFGA